MRYRAVPILRRPGLRLAASAALVAALAAAGAFSSPAAADAPATDPELVVLPEGAGTLTVEPVDGKEPAVTCEVGIPVTQLSLPDGCSPRYPKGTLVKVTAVPDPTVLAATFDRWSDYACPEEEPVCVVSMSEDRSLTAFFSPVFLKVKAGSFGPVTLSPPGNVCTFMPDTVTGDEGPCQFPYDRGTEVTPTRDPEAAPDASTHEWTGACTGDAATCELKLLANTFVRAGTPRLVKAGAPPLLSLTLRRGGSSGSITASEGQPGSCKKTKCVLTGLRNGERVLLRAKATNKTKFVRWQDGPKGPTRPIVVGSVTAAKAVFANKKKKKK